MHGFEKAFAIQLAAQAGGELVSIDRRIVDGIAAAVGVQTSGMGGQFVWPALRRQLDRTDASYAS